MPLCGIYSKRYFYDQPNATRRSNRQTNKQTNEWLKIQGYRNPRFLPDDYDFSVFIVDLFRKEINGTNTTCMAAACSSGNRPIVYDFEQLKEKLSTTERQK